MGCGLPACQMQLFYMFLGPDRAFRMPAVLVCSLLGGQELAHSAAHGNAYESAPDCMFGDLCWKIFLRSSLMCRQVCVCYSVCRAWVSFAHEYIRGVNFEQWPDRMRGGGAVHDSVCDPDASHAVCSTLQYAALKHRPLQDMHGALESIVFIRACTVAALTAGCAQYPRIADVHAADVCTSSLAMESVAMLQRQLLASSRECSRNCAGVSCLSQQRRAPALLLLCVCVLHMYGLFNAGWSAELQLELCMATASFCTAWQLVLDSGRLSFGCYSYSCCYFSGVLLLLRLFCAHGAAVGVLRAWQVCAFLSGCVSARLLQGRDVACWPELPSS